MSRELQLSVSSVEQELSEGVMFLLYYLFLLALYDTNLHYFN